MSGAFHMGYIGYILNDYANMGDPLARLILFDQFDKEDLGEYQTALELSLFPVHVGLRLAETIWQDDLTWGQNQTNIIAAMYAIQTQIETAGHLAKTSTLEGGEAWWPLVHFSLPDQRRMLKQMETISPAALKGLRKHYSDRTPGEAKGVKAYLERITKVTGFLRVENILPMRPVKVHQGGKPTYGVFKRTLSRAGGPILISEGGISEWGFSVPAQPALKGKDDEKILSLVSDIPGHIVTVTSGVYGENDHKTVITMDGDKPKSQGRGELTVGELKMTSWTFTVAAKPEPEKPKQDS